MKAAAINIFGVYPSDERVWYFIHIVYHHSSGVHCYLAH